MGSAEAWVALFQAAYVIGPDILDAVKSLAAGKLTPQENAEVLSEWDDNVARSARNAGIDPTI